ncbi:hypothetical protein LSTR_LSTR008418 [Laodelphax striatellus]|uniref:Odorant receptor n=1 Tax=Laodelphax striatellus TaxID=195883 RepID=A0A482XT01_LAOST|nr:hypothetical protein LSTR_LSTR008418 [Laodelphax striatellus]
MKDQGRIVKASREKLVRYLKLTNLYPKEEATLFGKFIYAFVNYMFLQTMFAIIKKWSIWNFNSKVSAIESLNNNMGTLGLVNDIFPFFNHIPVSIAMVDDKYFSNENDNSFKKKKQYMKREQLIDAMEQKTVSLVNRLEIILICFYTGYMLAPAFGIILHVIKSQSLSQVILPFMFFVSNESSARSPPVFSSLQSLLPVFLVESFYIYIQLICTVILHTRFILTVSHVSVEIDLFCMDLEELCLENIESNEDGYYNERDLSRQERKLQLIVRNLVIHHQLILNKVQKLNSSLVTSLVYGNSFLTIQLAILIFCLQQHPDFLQRIRYAIMMIPLLFMLIAYSEYGQRIENQGNKMRLALHNFPWQAKPKWVQSTLKILMIRSNMSPQISSVYNFFKQNRENMSKKEGEIKKIRDKLIRYLKQTNLYPRATVFGKFLYLFVNYVGVQTLYAISQKWSSWDFNSKVSAIESLNNNWGTLGLINDLFILPKHVRVAIEMVDGRYFTTEKDMNSKNKTYYKEKMDYIYKTEMKTVSLVNKLEKIMACFYTAYMLAPTFGIILYLINMQTLSQVTLPFLFYFSNESTSRSPPVFSSLQTLLPVFILESFYIYMQFVGTFICHTVCILTVSNVSLEIDLFCMNIREISLEDSFEENSADKETSSNHEGEFRLAVRDLVLQHRLIFRKIEAIKNIFLFRLIYGNIFLTIELALLIFCFQKHPDIIQRTKYGIMMIPLLSMLVAYSEYGQIIENQGDKMRIALLEFPWQTKPEWVQSSLRILTIRSNMLPHIPVFNIFKQNRENLSKLMKLAYTYFNLLDRVSS